MGRRTESGRYDPDKLFIASLGERGAHPLQITIADPRKKGIHLLIGHDDRSCSRVAATCHSVPILNLSRLSRAEPILE